MDANRVACAPVNDPRQRCLITLRGLCAMTRCCWRLRSVSRRPGSGQRRAVALDAGARMGSSCRPSVVFGHDKLYPTQAIRPGARSSLQGSGHRHHREHERRSAIHLRPGLAQLPAQGIAGRSHECHGSQDCAGQRHHRGRLHEQFEPHHLPRPRRPTIGCLRCRRGTAIVVALMDAAWECAVASLPFVSHRNGVPGRKGTFCAPLRMR